MPRSISDELRAWLVPILEASEGQNLVIGPVVHRADRGWYFTLVSNRRSQGMTIDAIQSEDWSTVERTRSALLAELYAGPPRIVHIFDDELDQARICELLWPSPRATDWRVAAEKERRNTSN